MRCYRVDITAWTASFRYPNLLTAIQPTLDVPPLSTVLGLLNAAAGKYLEHEKLQIGYYFEYAGKQFDTETIYQMFGSGGVPTGVAKSNAIQRQFLFESKLSIYLQDPALVAYFDRPVYQILLGRSQDLATIEHIAEVELVEQSRATKVRGQIVPFKGNMLPGMIQPLPKYFTNTFPRQNLGTEPYSVINHNVRDQPTKLLAWRDASQGKLGVDIFMHQFSMSDYELG